MKASFTGYAPDVDAVQSGPRWERALQREQAIGPITPGHHLCAEGRTLAEQVRILQADKHPLTPSIPTLSAWRKAYLAGGRRVQALLDNDRGGKGIPRGWLSNPDHQDLVLECEKRLICTSHKEYPPAALLRAQLVGRLGAARAATLPGPRALDRFRRDVLPRAERAMLAGGERRYRETVMPKPPAKIVDAHGVMLVSDHKQADVLVRWGAREVRPWITAVVDQHSGACRGLHVSPVDPGSTEIALALRDAIRLKPEDPEQLLCGLPDWWYTDQGKDYRSAHLDAALADLGIRKTLARPYSPWAKGKVEGNLNSVLSKQFDPILPGYVGNCPADRPHDVKAVITFEQYAAHVRRWALVDFNNLVFQKRRLNGQPASRFDFARAQRVPVRMPSNESLMLALLKRETRTIQPGGINLGGMFTFWNDALYALAEERETVEIRYDPADLSRVFVFHRGELLCTATDPRAADIEATEQTVRDRQRLRGERLKHLRAASREDRQAAMDPEAYLEHLAAQQTADVQQVAAVAGGGSVRPIRQILPRLDRAAQQLRRPGRPSGPRPLAPTRGSEDRLPDLADKPLPPGWE